MKFWLLMACISLLFSNRSFAKSDDMDIIASALGRELDIDMTATADGAFQKRIFTNKKSGRKILEQTLNKNGIPVKEVVFAENKNTAHSLKTVDLEKRMTVEEVDRNGDGTMDEKNETVIKDDQYLITTYKKNSQGKWEYFNSFQAPMKQEEQRSQCSFRMPFPTEDYATMTGKILLQKESGEMNETVFSGVRVHKSCIEKFGVAVMSKIFESFTKGLNCLHNFEGTGTQANMAKIISTITNNRNPVKIRCDLKGRADIFGAATSDPLDPDFPQIELYPDVAKIDDIAETVFHESFHLCGHRHKEGVEYAFGCESCCFSRSGFSRKDSSSKPSCRLCGTHKETRSYAYLSDYAYEVNSVAIDTVIKRMMDSDAPRDLKKVLALAMQYNSDLSVLYSELRLRMGKLSETDGEKFLSVPKQVPNDINQRSERDLAAAIDLMSRGKFDEAAPKILQAANKLSGTPAETRTGVQKLINDISNQMANYYDAAISKAQTPSEKDSYRKLAFDMNSSYFKSSADRNPPPPKPVLPPEITAAPSSSTVEVPLEPNQPIQQSEDPGPNPSPGS